LLPHPFPNCKNAAEGGRLRPAFGGILFCSQTGYPFGWKICYTENNKAK
jgi:hypothetical protein